MVKARYSRIKIARQTLCVRAFEHVTSFLVSADQRDVNEAANHFNARWLCDEFINHVGTLTGWCGFATNAKQHCSATQPEGAFI